VGSLLPTNMWCMLPGPRNIPTVFLCPGEDVRFIPNQKSHFMSPTVTEEFSDILCHI
jgi:hypothetical protein